MLNLEPACIKYSDGYATFVHEFLHAFGLHHEQDRPDRDSYITVDFSNIKKKHWWLYGKCKKCNTYDVPYDGKSLMHYKVVLPGYGIAIDDSKPVAYSKVNVLIIRLFSKFMHTNQIIPKDAWSNRKRNGSS